MLRITKCCDLCGKQCNFEKMKTLKQTNHGGMCFATVCKKCYEES